MASRRRLFGPYALLIPINSPFLFSENNVVLTLKRQSRLLQTTFINTFSLFFKKIRLNVSSESSARQRIHMKNQVWFSSKDKSKKLKCRLLQFLFGALRVNLHEFLFASLDVIALWHGVYSNKGKKNLLLEEQILFFASPEDVSNKWSQHRFFFFFFFFFEK